MEMFKMLGEDMLSKKADEPIPHIAEKTERKKILKLELPTSNVPQQQEIVAKTVYGLELNTQLKFSKDNTKWRAADEIYYNALTSYEKCITPFMELPRVYKLESTKEKLFEFRIAQTKKLKADAPNVAKYKKQSKFALKKTTAEEDLIEITYLDKELMEFNMYDDDMTEEEKIERELKTIINPYLPPKPWAVVKNKKGEIQYLNKETREIKVTPPGEIWAEKYAQMQKLKLR
jgi:hypothetical protein